MSAVNREVAKRVFAQEYNDGKEVYKEGNGEMDPKYLILPTGDRANRVLISGTLTEVEEMQDGLYRGRVADPTGTFLIYAGQYTKKARESLKNIKPPKRVSSMGKIDTYRTDEDEVVTSIKPEFVEEVGDEYFERWVDETATRTLERIEGEEAPLKEEAEKTYGDRERYVKTLIEALESIQ